MRYFDANCTLGRYNHWGGQQPITPADLLATMDHFGIHEALVIDSLSRENHPADGNHRLLAATADQPRLHPAWSALPYGSREMPPPEQLAAAMEEQGVRALFLYPQHYGFCLEDWCVDALLAPFAERRVPVFVCPEHLIGTGGADNMDWPGIVRLCRAFPELPVVATETRVLRRQRTMYQALEACPNLHLDLSALWHHRTVEFICREFGPSRLLFGSGLPTRDPGAVLGQLDYSEIAAADLEAIAGGNLRRLLSWTATPTPQAEVELPAPVDELHALARSGGSMREQRLACAHGHLGRHSRVHVPDGEPEELVAELERLGIERAVIFPNAGMDSDEVYGNDLVVAAVQQFPERFVGFALANLNRSPDEIRRELARCFDLGLRGVKLHPSLQSYPVTGPNVEVACAFANERRAFIVNHGWGDPDRLRYLCGEYPDACIMTGHTNIAAAPVVKEFPNLYIGTCPLTGFGMAEKLVAAVGADRIIYGSDLSWDPAAWVFGPLLYARIPVADKRLILGENLRQLLTRYGQ